MKYIEAISDYNIDKIGRTLFLAGGITDCPNWQQDMVKLLADTNLTIFNPRRANFPKHDPNAHSEQVRWEYVALSHALAISFWFPKETLCPIVLYELGAWGNSYKPIFVGIHPEYKRRQDVETQIMLLRPKLEIVYSLKDLSEQIKSDDLCNENDNNTGVGIWL